MSSSIISFCKGIGYEESRSQTRPSSSSLFEPQPCPPLLPSSLRSCWNSPKMSSSIISFCKGIGYEESRSQTRPSSSSLFKPQPCPPLLAALRPDMV
ncbi:hypothetical protein OIU78_009717 [Salix suchowensis]|nr:hypothetical protein OIU78_009717 [Salix suchowensis]